MWDAAHLDSEKNAAILRRIRAQSTTQLSRSITTCSPRSAMSRSHPLRLCFLTLVFSASVLVRHADAQSSNATLHGIVADASGAVLPGVTVKLQAPATGLTRDVVTNTSGVYVFNFLPAGEYVIVAELTGFKSARQADIKLEIGQSLVHNLKMEVGRLEEVVNVEATAPVLDRTS